MFYLKDVFRINHKILFRFPLVSNKSVREFDSSYPKQHQKTGACTRGTNLLLPIGQDTAIIKKEKTYWLLAGCEKEKGITRSELRLKFE